MQGAASHVACVASRARQAQELRQPMPPSTLRARYGPRWLGQGREATLGDAAEAGLQGLPYGVVVGLGVAGYVERRHRAQNVVGSRRGTHSEEEPRTL